ncbi:MarR family winged helix-turn-helix transcriptional regulator [Candidatus Uabimicrobium sp. HlEnr_7]|uniref:MarR family winged helix-turn-helix transcriptional regulator n=1 Tax=Candidatus Uabimicrobium helgolandensis TaxID=3095367 RepID=UPI003556D60E
MKKNSPKIDKFIKENNCVCFNVRKISRLVTQVYDEAFRSTGFKATQIAVLFSVSDLSPITISQLAQAMTTDRTTISRNLKPLQREHLVLIKPGEDKRQKNIHITTKGKKLVEEILPLWKKCQQKLFSAIGDERLAKILSELADISSIIQKEP